MKPQSFLFLVLTVVSSALFSSCGRNESVSQNSPDSQNIQPVPVALIITNYVTNYITAKPASTPKDIYKRVSESIVLIKNIGENGEVKSVGSGFYIGSGNKIATNFHVIEGATKLEITDADGTVYFVVDVVGVSRNNDLAILMCPASGKPLIVSTNLPEIGDHIVTLGNPKGLQRTISDGLISGIRDNDNSRFYQMSAPISPGSSGGPVLNDRGEVIGVSTFTFLDAQNINFAVPSKYLLDIVSSGYSVPLISVSKSPKNTVLLGKKGLEIIKAEIISGDFGISIRNHTKNQVNGVWVRIEYFEKPSWADTNKIEEIRREITIFERNLEPVKKSIADYQDRIRKYERSKSVLESFIPESSTESDIIKMRNIDFFNTVWLQFFIEAKQKMQMNNKGFLAATYYDHYSSQLLSLKRETASSLSAIESNLKSIEGFKQDEEKKVDDISNKISTTKERLEKAENMLKEYNLNKQENLKLVHYDDYFLENKIDANMVKYYEIQNAAKRDWVYKVNIIDYIYTRSKEKNYPVDSVSAQEN